MQIITPIILILGVLSEIFFNFPDDFYYFKALQGNSLVMGNRVFSVRGLLDTSVNYLVVSNPEGLSSEILINDLQG